VLGIIALLVAVSISWLGNSTVQAQLQSEVHQLMAFDRILRNYSSQNLRQSSLQIDFDLGRYGFRMGDSNTHERSASLNGAIKLKRFRTLSEDISDGTIQVKYSCLGTSETFAIEFVANQKSKWLLFSGITGQVTHFEEREDVEAIFQSLHTLSADAR